MTTIKPDKLDRSLDPTKVQEFKESLIQLDYPDLALSTYDEIISQTRYINFDTFYQELVKVAKRVCADYPAFNVFIDHDDLWHSENWCIGLVWPIIKQNVKAIFYDYEAITDNLPLLLIDDCIYTGLHLSQIMLVISKVARIEKKLKVILALPFISDQFRHILPGMMSGLLTNDHIKIDMTKLELTNEIYIGEIIPTFITNTQSLAHLTIHERADFLLQYFGAKSPLLTAIYFDHKIANEWGTFTEIYSKTIGNPVSRLGISEFANMLSDGQEQGIPVRLILDKIS